MVRIPEVGSGWVEIEPRVTKKDIAETKKTIQKGLEGIKANVNVGVTNTNLATLRKKIQAALSNITVGIDPKLDKKSVVLAREAIQDALSGIRVKVFVDVDGPSLARARAKIKTALSGVTANVGVRGGGTAFARTVQRPVRGLDPDPPSSFLGSQRTPNYRSRHSPTAIRRMNDAPSGFPGSHRGPYVGRHIGMGGGFRGRHRQPTRRQQRMQARQNRPQGGRHRAPTPPRPPGGGGGRRRSGGNDRFRVPGQRYLLRGGPVGTALRGIADAFQLSGPVGGAIILGIMAAVAAAAVPAGAMLGGLMTVAIGSVGILGAALIGAVDNPKVDAAAERFRDKWRKLIVDPNKGPFGNTLVGIIDGFTAKLESDWAEPINRIFVAGNKFMKILADGFSSGLDIFLPGAANFIDSDFMTQAMERFGKGFSTIAQAFVDGWDSILNDPKAQAGYLRGIDSFFGGVAWVIGKAFEFFNFLARTWEDWNTIVDSQGLTKWDRIKAALLKVWEILKGIIEIILGIANWFISDQGQQVLGTAAEGLGVIKRQVTGEPPDPSKGQRTMGEFIFDRPAGSLNEGRENLKANLGAVGTAAKTGGTSNIVIKGWEAFTGMLDDFFGGPDGDHPFDQLKKIATQFSKDKINAAGFSLGGGFWSDINAMLQTAAGNKGPGAQPVGSGPKGKMYGLEAKMEIEAQKAQWSTFPGWFGTNVTNPVKSQWSGAMSTLGGAVSGGLSGVAGIIVGRIQSILAAIRTALNPLKSFGLRLPFASGGLVMAAGGGMITGPGTARSDSIPAMLSNGEYVVNASATSRNLGLLESINNGGTAVPNVNVYVDGVAVAHKVVVDKALNSLAGSLRAGRI